MMNVAFLTSSTSRQAGGIFEIERRLAQLLAASGDVRIDVLGLADEYTEADLPDWRPVRPSTFPIVGPGFFGYSPHFARSLSSLDPDLVHVQHLWMYPSVAARAWSRRTRRPYMMSVHGMLDSWAIRNSRWKKGLASFLYERGAWKRASCLHVNTESEAAAVRRLGLSGPLCIIPNGVDIPDLSGAAPPKWSTSTPAGQKTLLFLGRLHPKKGLVQLVHGWKLLHARDTPGVGDWQLVIAGWDQGGHREVLESLVHTLGLRDHVRFTGPLFGAEKAAALAGADAFVLPSFSEGLPMAVLEAWAHALPVVMTAECNLPDGFSAGAALAVRPDAEAIARGLADLVAMADGERTEMGARGLELVRRRFSWASVSEQMLSVYHWMLAGEGHPEPVRVS